MYINIPSVSISNSRGFYSLFLKVLIGHFTLNNVELNFQLTTDFIHFCNNAYNICIFLRHNVYSLYIYLINVKSGLMMLVMR